MLHQERCDIENIPLRVDKGTPIYVRTSAQFISAVTSARRGGDGRQRRNRRRHCRDALRRTRSPSSTASKGRSKKSILVAGGRAHRCQPYDRSELIKNSIRHPAAQADEESINRGLVCVVFLWHLRPAFVAIITLPIAILLSFIPMLRLGLTSNIMSLGGIAIAIGAMVDSAIIMVENAHKFPRAFREKHGCEPSGRSELPLLLPRPKASGVRSSFHC